MHAEQRSHRAQMRKINRRRHAATRTAALRQAFERRNPRPAPAISSGWDDTVAMVRRLRRTTFRRRVFRARQLLRPASAAASFALVVAAVTPSLAHWVDETSANVGVSAGNVEMSLVGDLSFELEGCTGEAESGCYKLEDEELTGLPIVSVGEASLRIVEWIDKTGEPGEHVGFRFELLGGKAELTVKSDGIEHAAVFDEPGTHSWLNPAGRQPTRRGAPVDSAVGRSRSRRSNCRSLQRLRNPARC